MSAQRKRNPPDSSPGSRDSGAGQQPPGDAAPGTTWTQLGFFVAALLLWLAGMIIAAGSGNTVAALILNLLGQVTLAAWLLAAGGYGFAVLHWVSRDSTAPAPAPTPRAAHAAGSAALQWTVGVAAMLLINYLLALAHLLNAPAAWAQVAIGLLLLVLQVVRLQKHGVLGQQQRLPTWAALAAVPAAGVLLLAAACPPGTLWSVEAFGYDALSYHLPIAREFLAAGNSNGLNHNVYSFLPSLAEVGYAQLAALAGSMHQAIFASQLLHAAMALLTAVLVYRCLRQVGVAAAASALAGAAALALPWTIITASLPYDEMFSNAFAAAGLLLILQVRTRSAGPASTPTSGLPWRTCLLIGLLLGAAAMAKLTAAPLLAAPLLLLWLWPGTLVQPDQGSPAAAAPPLRPSSRRWGGLALILIAAALTIAPYLLRNALQTGNPVFPFAAEHLGSGHWSADQVHRWQASHQQSTSPDASASAALLRQWLLNAGYGAIGGRARPASGEMARFTRENGLSTFWLLALAGLLAGAICPRRRNLTCALLALLLLQLALWLLLTHRQSRFLLPTVLPGAMLLGLALSWPGARPRSWAAWAPTLAGVLLVCWLTVSSIGQLRQQTIAQVPVAALAASLPDLAQLRQGAPDQYPIGDHLLNHLPAGSKTLLVADANVLYIRSPIVYHSAYDAEPLGELYRQAQGDPAAVAHALRQLGITHVWVHWSELARITASFGYDPQITEENLRRLAGSWRVVASLGPVTLYALP